MMPIPDKLTDFRIYDDAKDLVGIADVDLPSFEADGDEMKGAGIAGTLNTPAIGQFKSMSINLTFRTVTDSSIKLLAPKVHKLSLYGSIQHFDGGAGVVIEVPCKVYAHCLPKKKEMGKFDSGKNTGTKLELEIVYIKMSLNKEDRVEFDRLGYIFIVDGFDYLAKVRANLGMN